MVLSHPEKIVVPKKSFRIKLAFTVGILMFTHPSPTVREERLNSIMQQIKLFLYQVCKTS
jgi:hypothetical protein